MKVNPTGKKKGNENKKHIITEKEFSEHLRKLVSLNRMENPFVKEVIDYKVFSDLYIENENKYLKQFNYLIVSQFKFQSLLLFPKQAISFIFSSKSWTIIGKFFNKKKVDFNMKNA